MTRRLVIVFVFLIALVGVFGWNSGAHALMSFPIDVRIENHTGLGLTAVSLSGCDRKEIVEDLRQVSPTKDHSHQWVFERTWQDVPDGETLRFSLSGERVTRMLGPDEWFYQEHLVVGRFELADGRVYFGVARVPDRPKDFTVVFRIGDEP